MCRSLRVKLQCALVAFTLLTSSSVLAEELPQIAVLDFKGNGVDAALLPTLSQILTVEISDLGQFKVITSRDLEAILGFEAQKDLLGCDEATCIAEIGGALGVERIVAGHIGRVGSTFVVSIKVLNVLE